MLRYSGSFGNTIFFVCSAWFLIDSNSASKKKIMLMIADIWIVSIIILIIVYIYRNGLNVSLILKSLFPTTFSNNWYLTCYLIFYAIHPFLNRLIKSMNQKELFRVTFFSALLYCIITFATRITSHIFGAGANFFNSALIIWIVIYFIMAYTKHYTPKLSSALLFNTLLIVIGFVGNYGLIFLTNVVGLRISLLKDALLVWQQDYNPFLIILVIGLFNLARSIQYECRIINYISKLSLFIYIIHENILLKTLYRPAMWQYIFTRFGYNHILGWVFVLVISIFVFGLVSSIIYYESIHRVIVLICNKLYPRVSSLIRKTEANALHIH